MSRFHFHSESETFINDDDGVELDDIDAARIEAARVLSDLLGNGPHDFWRMGFWRIITTDDEGLVLFTLDLGVINAPALGRA